MIDDGRRSIVTKRKGSKNATEIAIQKVYDERRKDNKDGLKSQRIAGLDLRYDDINFETNLISIWINKGDRHRSIPVTKENFWRL